MRHQSTKSAIFYTELFKNDIAEQENFFYRFSTEWKTPIMRMFRFKNLRLKTKKLEHLYRIMNQIDHDSVRKRKISKRQKHNRKRGKHGRQGIVWKNRL